MKITLEIEEADLRNMIDKHFRESGFIVKNLDALCTTFATAFPQGIHVYADIAPMETNTSKDVDISALKEGVSIYKEDAPAEEDVSGYGIEPQKFDEFDVHPDGVKHNGNALTLPDLLDPTPRLGRREGKRTNDTDVELETIIRRSKNLEK